MGCTLPVYTNMPAKTYLVFLICQSLLTILFSKGKNPLSNEVDMWKTIIVIRTFLLIPNHSWKIMSPVL